MRIFSSDHNSCIQPKNGTKWQKINKLLGNEPDKSIITEYWNKLSTKFKKKLKDIKGKQSNWLAHISNQ